MAWKFRSMVQNADEVLCEYLDGHPDFREEWEWNHKLKNDPRITWIGRLLRHTSLDELPQLWNALKQEMSLVGPRPIVQEEIRRYGEDFLLYQMVTPGITGLWQVSGRNNVSYERRISLDSYYVRNWSVWLDLWVLARTIRVVLKGDGAY
jgi:lipopolysaccharide/colanic/teichoic acid biosynthesis glycosyltransferase